MSLVVTPFRKVADFKKTGPQNRLLAALPPEEYKRLLPKLELVRLPRNRIICESGDAIRHAYFLNDGMASLLAITEDGSTIEMGIIGREGYIGAPILQHVGIMPYRVSVQMPVTAFRMEAKAVLLESNRGGTLGELLLRYGHVVEMQLVQAVVCNLEHTVEQRLARRLMVMSDYLESDTFDMTQEQLSGTLHRHRNRVSVAGGVLRERGLIKMARSKVTIVNRPGLEAAACQCYEIIRESIKNSFQI